MSLTTDAEHSAEASASTLEMMADWLGAGLDPEQLKGFIQSRVPEHAELHLLFSMVVPVGWLERVPTYKEMVEQLGIAAPLRPLRLSVAAIRGHPHVQGALGTGGRGPGAAYRAHPRGGAALQQHVEARVHQPQAKLTQIRKGAGHGRPEDVQVLRQRDRAGGHLRGDHAEDQAHGHGSGPEAAHRPGNPEICPVFDLHRIFTPEGPREGCARGCRTAAIGCLDCKAVLLEHMLPPLAAIRERRQRWAERPKEMLEILHEGSRRAQAIARATMDEVRDAIRLEP